MGTPSPPLGWTKLKFDWASRGNPSLVGLGCTIYSNKRFFLAKSTKPLGVISNNLEKLEALIEGLLLWQDLGIKNLVTQGDTQIILNELSKMETPNWILKSKLEYVLAIVDDFEKVTIKHIYREGNKEVGGLANKRANGKNIYI